MAVILMMVGLYVVLSRHNLIKKLVGLNIFQTSVFILYVSMGKIHGGIAPIYVEGVTEQPVFSNPVPHVLMLTAIVVGIATTALGLSLVVLIKKTFNTIEEDEIQASLDKKRRKP
ncbi:MAG: cation:proton antiporter subunit C [Magnetococcales bacterium]|nr:cation:proton antiporter subunit C [Magnetococcales bacterium]